MVHRKKKYKDKYVRAFMCGTYAMLHVKVPDYLRVWYVAKFGSPVILGQNHPARSVLEESLVSTDRVTYGQYTAMSDRLWEMAVEANAVNESEWLEFVLPEYVVRNGDVMMVDHSCEIYDAEIRPFKEELAYYFWNDVVEYINAMRIVAQDLGKPYRADWTLEMYCAEHGITVDMFEQFRRAYYRYKKDCVAQEKDARERVLKLRDVNLRKIGEKVRYQMLKFLENENADE